MSTGIVVDANVMNQFDKDYRAELASECRTLIEHIAFHQGFAVDEGGQLQQEWLATCKGPFFREWYAKLLYENVIRLVKPSIEAAHKKHLTIQLGFPSTTHDLVYIKVANVTSDKYILTEDMDFYDPKLKCADQGAKRRARDQKCGAVCRYLKKTMGIAVGTIKHAVGDICT